VNKLILILITFLLITISIQPVSAASIEPDYKVMMPVIINNSFIDNDSIPAGDYISRNGDWVVTFTEPKLVIYKEITNGITWYFVEIRYKNYPGFTAWVTRWEIK